MILEVGRSHAALARKVNELAALQGVVTRYDKASVTRWLQGMTPRDRAPEFIAAALADFLGRPIAPVDLGFPEQQQRPVVARALTYREDVGETLHTLAELGSTDISRRSLLGATPFVATALMDPQRQWLLSLLEDDQAPRLAAVADGGPAEQVQAMIEMFDEMDNRFGGGGVRASIVHYLSTQLAPMLQQRNLPAHQRRPFYTAVAKMAATAGWCSYDTADYGLAERYMIQALRLCAEGGDRVLGGQILAGMSHLATSLGNPAEGVSLARAGIATAKSSGSPLGLMRLHAMAARGYAALGNARQATASLHAAGKSRPCTRPAKAWTPAAGRSRNRHGSASWTTTTWRPRPPWSTATSAKHHKQRASPTRRWRRTAIAAARRLAAPYSPRRTSNRTDWTRRSTRPPTPWTSSAVFTVSDPSRLCATSVHALLRTEASRSCAISSSGPGPYSALRHDPLAQ